MSVNNAQEQINDFKQYDLRISVIIGSKVNRCCYERKVKITMSELSEQEVKKFDEEFNCAQMEIVHKK